MFNLDPFLADSGVAISICDLLRLGDCEGDSMLSFRSEDSGLRREVELSPPTEGVDSEVLFLSEDFSFFLGDLRENRDLVFLSASLTGAILQAGEEGTGLEITCLKMQKVLKRQKENVKYPDVNKNQIKGCPKNNKNQSILVKMA